MVWDMDVGSRWEQSVEALDVIIKKRKLREWEEPFKRMWVEIDKEIEREYVESMSIAC